jgi:Trehalase
MKHHRLTITGFALLLVASMSQAQIPHRWNFDRNGDRENWTAPAASRGAVMGGSLWLTLEPKETDPTRIAKASFQWEGDKDPDANLLTSPSDLQLPAAQVTQVRLRVLNLSSLTDFFLKWRTREHGWGDEKVDSGQPQQSRRCTLKPDTREWQEITCYIDQRWQGTIEQIAIAKSAQTTIRGNLWIDWIEIAKGAPEPVRERPDVSSSQVVPKVTIPDISQDGFADAFKALDQCLTTDVPIYGFNYPVMSPGGYYTSGGWWQLDSSLAVTGAKWVNQQFVEDVMRGFGEVQNPDGRIDPVGYFWIRGQPADLSSLPKFLEVAYDVARRSNDVKLRGQIYESMRKYLDWWLSPVKRDARTGLISGIGEETFGDRWQAPHLEGETLDIEPMTLAPVDTNVVVAVGALNTARLAEALGKRDAVRYRGAFASLTQAINTYMWDEGAGAYYNYDLHEGTRRPGLSVTIFDPLRLQIATAARRDRLLKRLLDPAQFNWGKRPLTSWAMTEPGVYVEAASDYDGRAWFGDIWTLRNMTVVAGLEESLRPDLAAELNWATIKTFHSNYREYVLPSTGEGLGAKNYAWTASQYIGAIIEHLFGIDYDASEKRLRIAPHVPKALYGKNIALAGLILPNDKDTRLTVHVKQTSPTAATIQVEITGPLPEGDLLVTLPGTQKEYRVPVRHSYTTNLK